MITAILIYGLAHWRVLVAPPAAINAVALVSVVESARSVEWSSNSETEMDDYMRNHNWRRK